ncbi:MAG: hypothetical protein MUC76_09720 [Spirochaetes bacterium]|nr:hypothetical protein [Spirochaetota bacterium]
MVIYYHNPMIPRNPVEMGLRPVSTINDTGNIRITGTIITADFFGILDDTNAIFGNWMVNVNSDIR